MKSAKEMKDYALKQRFSKVWREIESEASTGKLFVRLCFADPLPSQDIETLKKLGYKVETAWGDGLYYVQICWRCKEEEKKDFE